MGDRDHVPFLKRGPDGLFVEEINEQIVDGEDREEPGSKKMKNLPNLEVSLLYEEPKSELEAGIEVKFKEECSDLEVSLGEVSLDEVSSDELLCKKRPKVELEEGEVDETKKEYGEVSLKKELKSEYNELKMAGVNHDSHMCKREPKDELGEEEETAEELKLEYGELDAGMGKQKLLGDSFCSVSLKPEPKEESEEFGGKAGSQEGERKMMGFDVVEEGEIEEEPVDPSSYESFDVSGIVAGKEKVSFVVFKELVEFGRLKREDLSIMRSARVIEVPGKGEVIQFLRTSNFNLKSFNKIDLKELDLDEVSPFKDCWEKHPTWIRVSEVFKKKETSFMCNVCQTTHLDVESAFRHYVISHLQSTPVILNPRDGKMVKACLRHMCDPGLMFQHVIISMEAKKKYLKSEETNFYEKAADILSNVLSVKWVKISKKRGSWEFTCKICDFSVASKPGRKNGPEKANRLCCIRTSFMEHLTGAHFSNCLTLSAQLGVAPGEKLNALLFEAMMPNLHNV